MKLTLNTASNIALSVFIAGSIFVLFSCAIKESFSMQPYAYKLTPEERGWEKNPETGYYHLVVDPSLQKKHYTTMLFDLWASEKEVRSIIHITIACAIILLLLAFSMPIAYIRSGFAMGAVLMIINSIFSYRVFFGAPSDPFRGLGFLAMLLGFAVLVGVFYWFLKLWPYDNPRLFLIMQTYLALSISCFIVPAIFFGPLFILIAIMVIVSSFFSPIIFVSGAYTSAFLIINYLYKFPDFPYANVVMVMGTLILGLLFILASNIVLQKLRSRA